MAWRETFSASGPVHLKSVDWTNSDHRRVVAASLVKGVYVLERDRQNQRHGPQSLAFPWWDSFDFKLVCKLFDDADRSVCGAVYGYKYKLPFYNNNLAPPKYVVAFRGTIVKLDTLLQYSWLRDVELNHQIIRNNLQQSTRFWIALQALEEMVAKAGAENIWLVGHSLGSAIALLAGKNMVKEGCFIKSTYLFNPPFPSAPIELIENKRLKDALRLTKSFITAGIDFAVNDCDQRHQKDDLFVSLSGWLPYLFVNPFDPICAEYIGYFKHRDKMMEHCIGKIERIATQNSLRVLISPNLSSTDLEPLHLLPSANLTVNWRHSLGFTQAHDIHQWWNPNIHCRFNRYLFR